MNRGRGKTRGRLYPSLLGDKQRTLTKKGRQIIHYRGKLARTSVTFFIKLYPIATSEGTKANRANNVKIGLVPREGTVHIASANPPPPSFPLFFRRVIGHKKGEEIISVSCDTLATFHKPMFKVIH